MALHLDLDGQIVLSSDVALLGQLSISALCELKLLKLNV